MLDGECFIAMNRFTVNEGSGSAFEARFAARESTLTTYAGFKGFLLLRRDGTDEDGFTHSTWLASLQLTLVQCRAAPTTPHRLHRPNCSVLHRTQTHTEKHTRSLPDGQYGKTGQHLRRGGVRRNVLESQRAAEGRRRQLPMHRHRVSTRVRLWLPTTRAYSRCSLPRAFEARAAAI